MDLYTQNKPDPPIEKDDERIPRSQEKNAHRPPLLSIIIQYVNAGG